jgi:hypothetical protein
MVSPRAALLLLAAGLGGCDIGSTNIPVSEPQIVVHAVLNSNISPQVFLVEESLTGKITANENRPFDVNNPIVSGNGVPVSGAIVELILPDSTVVTATENRINNTPTGVYVIPRFVQPGQRYGLRIRALGKTVTGSTLVPERPAVIAASAAFNRDRDSLVVSIPDAAKTRAYWLRIESPLSSFQIFTVDRDVAISGDTRNLFTDNLLRVFVPGFDQTLTVAAMDTNLFDYYRSGNDEFSGVGLITHLEGGLGLFGSISVLERRVLDVTGDSSHAIEGTYTRRAGPAGFPHTLRIYMESVGPSETSGDRISGRYTSGTTTPVRSGLLGIRLRDSVRFDFFEPLSMLRSNGEYRAQIRGDTLRGFGDYNGLAAGATYVRVGK